MTNLDELDRLYQDAQRSTINPLIVPGGLTTTEFMLVHTALYTAYPQLAAELRAARKLIEMIDWDEVGEYVPEAVSAYDEWKKARRGMRTIDQLRVRTIERLERLSTEPPEEPPAVLRDALRDALNLIEELKAENADLATIQEMYDARASFNAEIRRGRAAESVCRLLLSWDGPEPVELASALEEWRKEGGR